MVRAYHVVLLLFTWFLIIYSSPKSYMPTSIVEAKTIASSSSNQLQSKPKFDSKSMLGQKIDYDENGNLDCFDIANEKIYRTTGVLPPKWKVHKTSKNILPTAKSILSDPTKLMVGQPKYQFIENPKSYELEDIVITNKGKDGHVAVVIGVNDKTVTVVEQDTYINKPAWTKSYPKNYWDGIIRITN